MPRDIYPTTDKKATLWKFKFLLYRAWRSRDVFCEGVIDLRDFTWPRARRRIDQSAIATALAGRTVIVAPETALPAALAICGRLNPPVRPDVIVALPGKDRHASRLVGFILNIYTCDHLGGFKLILARAPFAPVIAILRPAEKRSEITLVGVTQAGKAIGVGATSWPPHIMGQIRRLTKTFGAEITIWSRPESAAIWQKHFWRNRSTRGARIQVSAP